LSENAIYRNKRQPQKVEWVRHIKKNMVDSANYQQTSFFIILAEKQVKKQAQGQKQEYKRRCCK
jgi:hypothetical protein